MSLKDKLPQQALTPPQAVLFDWDNTLVDNWAITLEAMNETLRAFGFQTVSVEDIQSRPQTSLRESFPKFFGEDWKKAAKIYYKTLEDIHLSMVKAMPGAADLLEELSTHALYLGVVSNKHGDFLRQEVTHLGWDQHFKAVVGSLDAPQDKPHIDPAHKALEGSEMDFGPHIWFVGDSLVDMAFAKTGRFTPVLFGENLNTSSFTETPNLIHVKNFNELKKIINEVQSLKSKSQA